MTIDDLIAARRDIDTDNQPIGWNRAMWEQVWAGTNLPGRSALDLVAAEHHEHETIRRGWLRGLSDGDGTEFLVATIIWGYGTFGRGVKALRAMLATPDLATTVDEIVTASRRDAASGFGSLFAAGKTRIPWLGIAFGTKVVHFAGYAHTKPPPLILDKRVYLGATALGIDCVPDPTRYTTSAAYAAYCRWANEVADRNGVEPQSVEYALFTHGGDAKNKAPP